MDISVIGSRKFIVTDPIVQNWIRRASIFKHEAPCLMSLFQFTVLKTGPTTVIKASEHVQDQILLTECEL